MATIEQMTRLLAELGPALPEIGEIRQYDDTSWLVGFDADTEVELDYEFAQAKLRLAIDLGTPHPSRRQSLLETLLQVNYLRADTGGLVMALDGPGGEAIQLFELNAHALDLSTLATVLVNFVERAREWRQVVQAAAGGSEAGAPDQDLRHFQGMLRV